MDKITFESVMEEIKKSLGEARLKSIEEVWGVDSSPTDYADNAPKPKPKEEPKVATTEPSPSTRPAAPAPAATPAPAPAAAAPASSPAPATTARMAPGAMTGGSFKPEGPKPAPAATTPAATPSIPSTTARMAPGAMTGGSFKPEGPKPAPAPAPSVKSGVGDGSSGFGMKGPESGGKPVAPSAPKPSASKSVETGGNFASPTGSTTVAPPKGAGQAPKPAAPKTQGMTNQPAPSGDNKYGFKDSGSDDDTSANFFAADKRMMADKAAQSAPAKPAAPKRSVPMPPRRPVAGGSVGNVTPLAENFDQFVKKFLKESK